MERKKYQIIYADPPWSYKDKALAGKRGAGCKYEVMEVLDISKIDVGGGNGERLCLVSVGNNAEAE